MQASFPWSRYKVEGLDIHYLPTCRMSIQKVDGKWLEFEFKIDSGSDVTYMNKSDCVDLGYIIKEREILEYTNINNETHRSYVKKLNVKIDCFVMKRVPIAFSAKPIKTLLLGRARIFDLLNVYFDCKSKETIIFTPDELVSSKR